MPTAPMLPPDEMTRAQSTGGMNPVNFLIAAADLHNSGQLSSPVPPGKDLQVPAKARVSKKHLQVLK